MRKADKAASLEALARSQAARTLLKLFDELYEGTVVVDRDARIVWMNDKYKALIGWNGVEPIEGRPVETVIPNSQMRSVVETGRADLLDIFTVNDRQMVVSRIPLFDEAGNVTGALGAIIYDRLQALGRIVAKFQQMQAELKQAGRELAEQRRAKYRFSQFVGVSPPVLALKAQAMRAAEREATVLLLGETGTGKELLAHAIHAASPRAGQPMVRVNAAAIPDTLLEAELFGTAAGAYTGARPRPGKIELAQGGTLFLDEVGDMPLALQAKLLRVLQEREIEPLGSNKVIAVDVRVITATSRDLKRMVEEGSFRADLYYRLAVLPLRLPRLRERPDDIPILCEAILERYALENGEPQRTVAVEALDLLAACPWPGNVRELANVLAQASARDDARVLSRDHFTGLLPPPAAAAPVERRPGEVRPLRDVVAEAERRAIAEAIAAAGGIKVQAARLLGISRAQLYEKMAALGSVEGEIGH